MPVTARVLALPDSNGIKEIRNWLDQNPNEIVYVDFEEYVPQMGGPDDAVLAPIRAYLGDMVFTPPPDVPPASVTGSITDNVLTVTALGSGALGRGGLTVDDQITGTGIPPGTVIQSFGTGTGTYNLYKTSVTGSITNGVLTVTALGSSAPGWPIALYVDEQITGTGIPAGTFIQSFGTVTGGTCTPDNSGSTGPFGTGCYVLSKPSLTGVASETITTTLTVPSETITRPVKAGGAQGGFPDRWPTRREMLAAGKRVIILDNAYVQFLLASLIYHFALPLLSITYELPNLQAFCFDNVATVGGMGVPFPPATDHTGHGTRKGRQIHFPFPAVSCWL